jgi:hypothetical protein
MDAAQATNRGRVSSGRGEPLPLYVNVYWRENGLQYSVHRSRAEADDSATIERVACVKTDWKMSQYDAPTPPEQPQS